MEHQANPYCEVFEIEQPKLEDLVCQPRVRPYHLLFGSILCHGDALTLPEAAAQLSRAGAGSETSILAKLKRCRPARRPLVQEGERYYIDPHHNEAGWCLGQLGLSSPRDPLEYLENLDAAILSAATEKRTAVIHGFPANNPRIVTLVSWPQHSVESFEEDRFDQLAEQLASYQVLVGAQLRTQLRAIGFDWGSRQLDELMPTQKSKLNARDRVCPVTLENCVKTTLGKKQSLATAKALGAAGRRKSAERLQQLLERDAEILFRFRQFGRLHGRVMIDLLDGDYFLPAEWSRLHEVGMYSYLRHAIDKGSALEVVRDSQYSLSDPWAQTVHCRPVEYKGHGALRSARGEIFFWDSVHLCRMVERVPSDTPRDPKPTSAAAVGSASNSASAIVDSYRSLNTAVQNLREICEQPDSPLKAPFERIRGRVFAFASAPALLPPHVWLQGALGAEPDFASKREAEQVMNGVMTLYNFGLEPRDHLRDVAPSPLALPERMFESSNSHEIDETPIAEWSQGFRDGWRVVEEFWTAVLNEEQEYEFSQLWGAIVMFSTQDLRDEFNAGMAPYELDLYQRAKEFDEVIIEISDLAKLLYQAQLPSNPGSAGSPFAPPVPPSFGGGEASRHVATASSGNKQGRNERCACGSGLKFKRCCGKPGGSVH